MLEAPWSKLLALLDFIHISWNRGVWLHCHMVFSMYNVLAILPYTILRLFLIWFEFGGYIALHTMSLAFFATFKPFLCVTLVFSIVFDPKHWFMLFAIYEINAWLLGSPSLKKNFLEIRPARPWEAALRLCWIFLISA